MRKKYALHSLHDFEGKTVGELICWLWDLCQGADPTSVDFDYSHYGDDPESQFELHIPLDPPGLVGGAQEESS